MPTTNFSFTFFSILLETATHCYLSSLVCLGGIIVGGCTCAVPALCLRFVKSRLFWTRCPNGELDCNNYCDPYIGLPRFLLCPKTQKNYVSHRKCRIAVQICCFCPADVCIPCGGWFAGCSQETYLKVENILFLEGYRNFIFKM